MKSKQRSGVGQLVELVVIVAIALLLALGIQAFLIKPYRIPSGSMEPTLGIGQRVLVNRIGNRFTDPKVGEILVFHPPEPALHHDGQGGDSNECGVQPPAGQPCPQADGREDSQNFIKRVVAGPGDVITIRQGHVIRNGKAEPDSYTMPCRDSSGCDFSTALRVPAGHWFMMGDNRGDSDDSRFWGPVPKQWIIGGAFATYWPVTRIGLL